MPLPPVPAEQVVICTLRLLARLIKALKAEADELEKAIKQIGDRADVLWCAVDGADPVPRLPPWAWPQLLLMPIGISSARLQHEVSPDSGDHL